MENDNRKIIAICLILFLLFLYKETVWDAYSKKPAPDDPTAHSVVTQTGASQSGATRSEASQGTATTQAVPPTNIKGGEAAPSQPGALPGTNSMPDDQALIQAGEFSVLTDTLDVNVSLLGGRFTQVLLRSYLTELAQTSRPINLVERSVGAALPLGVTSGSVDDTWVRYRLVVRPPSATPSQSPERFVVSTDAGERFELEGELPDGRTIRKIFQFTRAGYLADLNVVTSAPPSDSSPLWLDWSQDFKPESHAVLDVYQRNGFTWFDGQAAHREPLKDVDEKTDPSVGSTRWISIADEYFAVGIISPDEPAPAKRFKHTHAYGMRIGGKPAAGTFRLYLGPKSYDILEESGYNLQYIINFGWAGFISAPLLTLLHFFYRMLGNYGLAIIALTILVRAVLYPLNHTAFKQMKAMQDLAPEVSRIKETIKDKQQQQVEMMALWKKHGVNPFGGCFPILLQMPIFIGLYSALLMAIELRHAKFVFWIEDLSAPERLMLFGLPYGLPIMVILFTVTMVVQQRLTPAQMDPAQKRVMMIMPLVFGAMFWNFPAGLALYWLTNNIISIGQQQAMNNKRGISPMLITGLIAGTTFIFAFILVKISG